MSQLCLMCLQVLLWTLSLCLDTNLSRAENVTISGRHNNTKPMSKGFFPSFLPERSMIQRALFVLIGITVIGLLYFLVRAVSLKKTTQRKKYGLLSNYDDNMEMAALESDEEDMTVYEAKSLRR